MLKSSSAIASFADKVDVTSKPLAKPKRRGKKQLENAPQFDLRTHLYRISSSTGGTPPATNERNSQ